MKLDPESLRARILVAIGFRLLQVWSHTIRFEIEDRGKILQTPVSERFIGAAWHNRLLLLPSMLQLADVIASGHDVVITPDGPRGPAYRPGGGIILLAQKTGARVVPLNLEYARCWRLPSWDKFILPRPFVRVRFILGQPHEVLKTSNEEEFEAERERLKSAMMALVEMR